ncbi:MAG TPA: dienelactone hydrolase family protein [Methylomusa anaerophila]|uniref:2,6-dihydropseudooxynicotine hydrolase n=1 Tax=Methylomusa anaerophila TaxID=1930071 RepID=A0A348AI55_9FIRM|nr:dienelactone hydrolase family protein [Methylomusa anaerophila]BBB90753.1 2,6-dihydropseudooxynicotine hydrolase [Methylomusa anaerophila]HML88643.1 dienelactone hydrolase family protein [Methylomusa anaerophila]
MVDLTLKEKFAFKFIFNESRVYSRWYGRFLSFGIDYGRLKRVIARIPNWLEWCNQWTKEGDELYRKAEKALNEGNEFKSRALFHEAVGCYHTGQHIFFIDSSQKEATQEKARMSYQRAIALYNEKECPIRIEVPFEGVKIPGYLRLSGAPGSPLIIFVNGMDNIKEAEGHSQGTMFKQNGFNYFTFDGPGQGEMWKSMKYDVKKYHKAVSAIIDWFEQNQTYGINMDKVALVGFSLGGYLAPMSAALDKRVKCVVGNSGLVFIGGINGLKRLNPIWQRGVTYMTGCNTLEAAVDKFDWDIEQDVSLKVPLLFYHAGRDEVMPSPKLHADKVMRWAKGEKTLKYFEHAEHCTQDYLDEVFPEIIDWFKKKLI